eukprot:CAMPEP_0176121616 /NCGR_PEP_ID=MMETSP0120_2-20121206/61225_1 /TAXON_ID=160619 /ORGANISM="Kryptoperidinium foliaceum, Strain CCMP 1326" /LENGTH=39 /DNA_ID= /DNA_START= /DNA_END= /DNA_ORIENTATION=
MCKSRYILPPAEEAAGSLTAQILSASRKTPGAGLWTSIE